MFSALAFFQNHLIRYVIPPPELHLYEHVVTKVTDILMSDVAPSWRRRLVTRYGYNGGGYNGPNCRKVLSSLDELMTVAPVPMIPCIQTLRKFKKGKYECHIRL